MLPLYCDVVVDPIIEETSSLLPALQLIVCVGLLLVAMISAVLIAVLYPRKKKKSANFPASPTRINIPVLHCPHCSTRRISA